VSGTVGHPELLLRRNPPLQLGVPAGTHDPTHARFSGVDAGAASFADDGSESLLAAYDAYADRLYAYGLALLADEDAAAAAVRDAFLVAAERVTGLQEKGLLCPWLYALTRNECLRRRPHRSAADQRRDLVELAFRHRLVTAEIAAVLGVTPADAAESVAALSPPDAPDPLPDPVAPAALRDRVVAAGVATLGHGEAGHGAEGHWADGHWVGGHWVDTARRAALSRRAGPFRADGFPHPLDRRRLSGRVLAVSIAVVALSTLALLTTLPGGGGTSQQALAGRAGPASLAVAQPAAKPSSWPAPRPAPATSLRPASQPPGPPSASLIGVGSVGPTGPSGSALRPGTPASDGQPTVESATPLAEQGSPSVTAWAENRTAPNCPGRWAARVQVVVSGVEASQVEAVWFDGARERTAALRQSGGDWVGELGGLSVGEQLWFQATATVAGGTTVSTGHQSLAYDC